MLGNDKLPILSVDNIEINSGELIGIKGASGAGKTTLINLITGLLTPQQGNVFWGNIDITQLSETKRDEFRRKNLGIIFQTFYLIEELSPFSNVIISTFFSSKKENKKIKELGLFYLNEFGVFDSKRDVSTFSSGERQRIAVARALSTSPKIIIADEPTASLDTKNAEYLTNALIEIAKKDNKTLIIISHDQLVLEKMDRIIELQKGVII